MNNYELSNYFFCQSFLILFKISVVNIVIAIGIATATIFTPIPLQ